MIALGLRLSQSDIDAMRGEDLHCLQSSLSKWLKGIDPLPTWKILVAVLKSRLVGEEKKAQELEKRYCTNPMAQVDPIQGSTVAVYTGAVQKVGLVGL